MEAYHYIQQVRDSGLIAESVSQESNQYFDYYYHAIQKGLAEKMIKPYPIELIGEILYRDIVAVMNLAVIQTNPLKRDEYTQLGFEIFWDGIKA